MTRAIDFRRMLAAVIGATIALLIHNGCDRGGDFAYAQPAPCEGYTIAVGKVEASDHEWDDPTGMTSTHVGEFSFQMHRASPWFHYVRERKGKPVKILIVPDEPRVLNQVIR